MPQQMAPGPKEGLSRTMGSLNKRQIQLRAGFLGGKQLCGGDGMPAAITAFPPDAALASEREGGVRTTIRSGHWLERDLSRAIGVAHRSRLDEYRIEIAPDGTITIVVGGQ